MKNFSFYGFITLMLLSAKFSQSQSISMEKTITYINEKLNGKYTVDVKKGYLILECFDQGKLTRRDHIELIAIEVENITFLEKERQIILKCKFDQAECIDRILPEAGKRTQVSRTAITIEADGKIEKGLIKAFTHMVKMIQFKNYENKEWFD